jgi:hypothetical protein
MATVEIPAAMIELFRDMDFIAGTPSGCKISPSTRTYDNVQSWSGWILRRLRSEGKTTVINFFQDTIGRTIKAINTKKEEKYYHILVTKSRDLRKGLVINRDSYTGPHGPTPAQIEINLIILSLDYVLPTDETSGSEDSS